MKIRCKVFGHKFMLPGHKHGFWMVETTVYKRYFRCIRCGVRP